MVKNRLIISADVMSDDFLATSQRLSEMAIAEDIAKRVGLKTEHDRDASTLYLVILIPADKLKEIIYLLRLRLLSQTVGTLIVCDLNALPILKSIKFNSICIPSEGKFVPGMYLKDDVSEFMSEEALLCSSGEFRDEDSYYLLPDRHVLRVATCCYVLDSQEAGSMLIGVMNDDKAAAVFGRDAVAEHYKRHLPGHKPTFAKRG